MCVIIGADELGRKELLAIANGYRESAQSWREVRLDLKRRSLMIAPELTTGDGALGFWKALREVYGTTREQRCWGAQDRQRAQQAPQGHPATRQATPTGHLDGRDQGARPFSLSIELPGSCPDALTRLPALPVEHLHQVALALVRRPDFGQESPERGSPSGPDKKRPDLLQGADRLLVHAVARVAEQSVDTRLVDPHGILWMSFLPALGEFKPEAFGASSCLGCAPGGLRIALVEEDLDQQGVIPRRTAHPHPVAGRFRRFVGNALADHGQGLVAPARPLLGAASVPLQLTVRLKTRVFNERLPDERHRLVAAAPPLIGVGDEGPEALVPAPARERPPAPFRPVEPQVGVSCVLVEVGDLEEGVRRGEIAGLDRDQGVEIFGRLRHRLHDGRDPVAPAVAVRVILARLQRRDLRPFRLGQPAIGRAPGLAQNVGVDEGGSVERVERRLHLPLEQPLGQVHGVGPSTPAGFQMKLLQAPEEPAHPAVGVVDILQALLDLGQAVFGQLDDAVRLSGLQQVFEGLDHLFDAGGMVVGFPIVNEAAGLKGVVEGLLPDRQICGSPCRLGGPDHQPAVQALVFVRLVEEHRHQYLLVQPQEVSA
ncbi:MAG: transposase [Gemmatimonadetes bacterium]|nr:transposase [Gemmatimonadota bacterium]